MTGPGLVRRAVWSLSGAGVGVVVAASAAYGLWAADVPFTGGPVIAGDLALTPGAPTWEQVTPGLSGPAGGALGVTPADFVTMPGDVIEITQPISTLLRGENIAAGLVVDYSDPGVVAGDIVTSFHVEDTVGQKVAPVDGEAQFGEVVVVPGLQGTDAGVSSDWNVVITVRVLGDYQWSDQPAGTDPAQWAAGALKVSLTQVRDGEGFEEAAG